MADKLNRIDVDLHLLASEDIKLLKEVSENFRVGLRGGGIRGSQGGSGEAVIGKTGGLASQGGVDMSGGADDPHVPGSRRTFYSDRLEGLFGKKYDTEGNQLRGNIYARAVGGLSNAGRDFEALSMMALGGPNALKFLGNAIASPTIGLARSTGNLSYGANLGYSTTGGALPFFSQASMSGLMNNTIHPLGNLFNMNFSPGQAKGVNDAIASFGYDPFGAGRGSQMRHSMQDLTKQYGNAIPASQMAGMLDPARYGGSSISGLTAQISLLGDAAKGANVTVSHMAESLQQVSQQIAQQLGTSGEIAGGQALAMSAGTGFSPEVAAKPMMNKLVQGMMIGMSGGNVFNAFYGKGASGNAFKGVEMIVQGLTGMNFTQLGQALNGPNAGAIKNRLATAYYANPDIFGGYTVEQVMELANRGDSKILGGMKLNTDLQMAARASSDGIHGGPTLSQLYSEARRSGLSSSEIAKLRGSSGSYHDQVRSLSNAMGDYNRKLQQQNANQTYLELTGYAKRILQKVVPEGSSSDANLGRFSGWAAHPTYGK